MQTEQERIDRLVDEVDRRLRRAEASPLGMRETTHSRLDVIIDECGFKNGSPRLRRLIQDAFVGRGIYPQPELTQDGLAFRHQIYFSRRPPRVPPPSRRMGFPREYPLERFVFQNFEFIDAFKDLERIKTQYAVPSRDRVDIMCRDRRSGDYVIVELKAQDADERIVVQVVGYMEEVEERARREGVGVRGMVITGQPNAALESYLVDLAKAKGYCVDWYTYRMDMTVQHVGGTDSS